RRFADARIAAEQHYGAAHQPAAGDAVELGHARGQARRLVRVALERRDGEDAALAGGPWHCGCAFFDQRVPGAARLAAASPARKSRAAALADKILRARHLATRSLVRL